MHLLSETLDLLANFIDLLACGVQLHRDDHGCPLCRPVFSCSEYLSPDFFLSQKIPRNQREIVAEKQKTHSVASGLEFFLYRFDYKFAPRPLFRWNPKSKPIRVGGANHGR